MIPALLLLAAFLILAPILFFSTRHFLQSQHQQLGQRLQEQFGQIENRLKDSMQQFVHSENDRFIHEQTKSTAFLEQNKQTIGSQIEHLNKELSQITDLVKTFEKDRDQKFGSLEAKIAQAATATNDLSEVTQKLNAIIGNNQQRGEMGQWIAEDILRAAGLEEKIHYDKNKSQDTASTRPDFTFYLPNKHKLHMDVKFPLSNYLAMTKATDKNEEERYRKDFFRDVKNRIRELKNRDYINREEQTLDSIILFIPNEQIFGFIDRNAPDIRVEALENKILLTSPYSLYGVLSIIRHAYDNFHFKESANEILKLIGQFTDDYENFKKRFLDLGESLDKTREKYAEVSEKSFTKLDLRIKKLEDFRKGQEVLEKTAAPSPEIAKQFILQ